MVMDNEFEGPVRVSKTGPGPVYSQVCQKR